MRPVAIVAAAVEALRVETPEVLDARQRDRNEAVEKFVHAIAAQRDLGADRHAFAQLVGCDRLAGPRDDRLLAGDQRKIRARQYRPSCGR